MRDAQLLSIRPKLDLETANSTNFERFQNETLRPILKFQHPILVEIARKGMEKHVKSHQNLTKTERDIFIEKMIQADNRLRRLLAGAIIGQFTIAEYAIFSENEPEMLRRLMSMLVQRLQSVAG
jgi:hypothetical protein